jgi:hypothetical protein
MNKTDEIKWDLTIIFENNEKTSEFMKACETDLVALQGEYKDKINRENITSKEIFDFLEKFNTVISNVTDVYYFTQIQLDADQTIKA